MTKPSTANGGYPNVVVTAVTATTSISPDIEGTWKGLLAGESGIRVLEDEFVTKWDLPVKIGGHLKESPDEQADTGVITPARAPSCRPTTAAAPFGMIICTASGDTLRGPPSFIRS